jgi:probable H4MPT-linked C1 transfer pathway protein
MTPAVLALDIGGANIKAAHSAGTVCQQPYALWKNPGGLAPALACLARDLPQFDRLALTMTGELCDCFATKRQGVHAILDAAELLAGGAGPIRVWQTDGRFVSVAEARAEPMKTAAANWLALAVFAGRFMPRGPALLLDIGSTTTDVVPLLDGHPNPLGRTDPERLRSQELVYTGVRRTPLCTILGADGAAELFATTQDVYLVLGDLAEDETDHETADGRPATAEAAHVRLAHMLGGDLECCSRAEVLDLAQRVQERQLQLLRTALVTVSKRLPALPQHILLSGAGEFLGRAALASEDACPMSAGCRLISLADKLSPEISQAACAYALMVLALQEGSGIRSERSEVRVQGPVAGSSLTADSSPTTPTLVVKVGGSLFDLADLGTRLEEFLEYLGHSQILLVPGGGPSADVVRTFDHTHSLGQEASHWLALQALALNARLLARLLKSRDPAVAGRLDEILGHWQRRHIVILDAFEFCQEDEGRDGALPHCWDVTSDAVAARAAVVTGARRLILLKSVIPPENLREAGERGIVDSYLAATYRYQASGAAGQGSVSVGLAPAPSPRTTGLEVSLLNFREWRAGQGSSPGRQSGEPAAGR